MRFLTSLLLLLPLSVFADTGAGLVTAQLVAQAQQPTSLEDLFPVLVSLVTSGQWGAFAVALLLGAVLVLTTVSGVRKFLGGFVPWLTTDRAGVVLSILTGQLGALLTALLSGAPVTATFVLGLIWSAIASAMKSWQVKGLAAGVPPKPVCTPDEIAEGTCKP